MAVMGGFVVWEEEKGDGEQVLESHR